MWIDPTPLLAAVTSDQTGLIIGAAGVGVAVSGLLFQVLKSRSDRHDKDKQDAADKADVLAKAAAETARRAAEAEAARREFERAMMGDLGDKRLGIPPVPGVFQRLHRLEVLHQEQLAAAREGDSATDSMHKHGGGKS